MHLRSMKLQYLLYHIVSGFPSSFTTESRTVAVLLAQSEGTFCARVMMER